MVTHKKRGISLMSALLLITIVMIIAATMAGVFTMNINITNRVSNASVALSEAEAGIAEVLYQITRDDNIEGDGNQENPKINWGLNGETIQATTTPGMQPDEAYHVVTFDTGSSFPYSTNNTTLTNDSGYNGRVVPDGMLHIFSTGYCKGQFRTIECVIEKPPFPFGLATSGKIDSVDPIRVLGTSSQSGYDSGETDRPGHILCNSPEGVVIGEAEGDEEGTFISGFVKSVGPVTIAQPAVVRGGIRSDADATTLTDIKIQDFNLDAEGAAGVVTLVDDDYHQDQVLDVMYKYLNGGTLKYHGKVELQQAMLWIDGNIEIEGPVTGEGLIVVNGSATIRKGADLNGTDKMALLAAGDIKLGQEGGVPAANHFSGLVYTEGNLDARNITVVGNAVANSPDPSKGQAILENVTLVSNEETGDMTINITSSGQLETSEDRGYAAAGFFNPRTGGLNDDLGHPGWLLPTDDNDVLQGIVDNELHDLVMANVFTGGDAFVVTPVPGLGGGFAGEFIALTEDLQAAQETFEANEKEIKDLGDKKIGLDPDDDADKINDINKQITILTNANATLKAETETDYNDRALSLLKNMRDKLKTMANSNGTAKTTVSTIDIFRDERFNLNEYLPQSDRVKMSFWKVYPRRM